ARRLHLGAARLARRAPELRDPRAPARVHGPPVLGSRRRRAPAQRRRAARPDPRALPRILVTALTLEPRAPSPLGATNDRHRARRYLGHRRSHPSAMGALGSASPLSILRRPRPADSGPPLPRRDRNFPPRHRDHRLLSAPTSDDPKRPCTREILAPLGGHLISANDQPAHERATGRAAAVLGKV